MLSVPLDILSGSFLDSFKFLFSLVLNDYLVFNNYLHVQNVL